MEDEETFYAPKMRLRFKPPNKPIRNKRYNNLQYSSVHPTSLRRVHNEYDDEGKHHNFSFLNYKFD